MTAAVTPADSRRWWALGALSLSVLVVALDLFVLTLALPTVSADLHASTGDLQWFVDAYSLVLAAALLPAGLLGDRLGRKRLLVGALALFGQLLALPYHHPEGRADPTEVVALLKATQPLVWPRQAAGRPPVE